MKPATQASTTKSSPHRSVQLRKLQAPYNTFAHTPKLLNPDFKVVKPPDIRLGVSNMDSFHGSLFKQVHFYLVFYSKYANNILVYDAAIDFL